MSSSSDQTLPLGTPAAGPSSDDATVPPDDGSAGFDHGSATLGDASADGDERTLAGDDAEEWSDVSHGTVDGERTLPGDTLLRAGGPPDVDGTLIETPTVDEDRTLVESVAPRRRAPAEYGGDQATLADPSPDASPDETDRTVVDARSGSADNLDATVVGDSPSLEEERTLVASDSPMRPSSDHTVEGENSRSPSEGTLPLTSTTTPPAPSKPIPGDHHYDLVEDFARGGMGKIWRAMDLRIKREVAFKELLPNALRNSVVVERFLKEAQVTGQLEHPGIVPIYDLGWQKNGTPFYSMKLVRGSTFKKSIEAYHALPKGSGPRRLAFVKVLQQFIAICNTMGYSHERSVLHRDLKPLNIMVGDFGETLVLDWGLARLMNDPDNSPMGAGPIDEEEEDDYGDETVGEHEAPEASAARPAASMAGGATQGGGTQSGGTQSGTQAGASRRRSVMTDYESAGSRTMMGAIMGTPAYMPPEQATGRLDELDPRSDVYSLGAILYEILTNQAPIAKDKLPAMLKAVVEGKITPPREIDPTIPKPLAAIAMKALSSEKTARYSSAMTLAREVEAYLADEPVAAYPEPWHQRLKRWMRRHPKLVLTTATVLTMSLVFFGAWRQVESARIAGVENEARARIAEAQSAIEANDFVQADKRFREAAGSVANEPKLAELQDEVRSGIENVARMQDLEREARLARVRDEVRRDVASADAARTRNDLNEALRLLTEARGKLAGEPALKEILGEVKTRIEAVSALVAQKEAGDAAQRKFQTFLAETDQARFYGSFFMNGSAEEQRKEAQKHGLAALAAYGIDRPEAALKRPALVSDAQFAAIRDNAFEVLLILADTEITLADAENPANRQVAAEAALAWIERAKKFGVVARILPVRESQALFLKGDEENARKAAEAAEKVEPTTALDFYLLGQDERIQGHFDAAQSLYQQALQVDPHYFWALENLGLCHLQSKRPEAAVAAYTAAVAARPDEPICYLTRAIAYADLKQFPAALADLKKAEELKAQPYDLHLNRGGVHFGANRLPEAVADFEAAAKVRPDQSAPHRNLALVYRLQADEAAKSKAEDEAAALYKKSLTEVDLAIERSQMDAVAYALRGDVEMRLGNEDQAVSDFRKAAQREPVPAKRATSLKEVGIIHQRKGRLDDAVKAYRQAIAVDDSDADVHRLLAEAYNKLGQAEAADAEWTKFLKLGEPVGDVYRGRGLSRASRGQYREAMNDYTRSLELEPSPNMLTRRGWAYLLQANKLALDDFDEAVRLNPENPDSYNGRGYSKVMMGDHAAAVADAEEAVKRAKAAAEQGKNDWQNFYNAATIFAQAVDRADKDAKLSAEDREKVVSGYTTRSLVILGTAVNAAGTKNRAVLQKTIQTDTALDPIRQRPEFLKIFAPKATTPKPADTPEKGS